MHNISNRDKFVIAFEPCTLPQLVPVEGSRMTIDIGCQDLDFSLAPVAVQRKMLELYKSGTSEQFKIRGYVESVVNETGQAMLSTVLGWIILRVDTDGVTAATWLGRDDNE